MGDKKKIMIVDDERDIRYILRRFLEDCNYDVVEAIGGPQCLETVESERPDLILMDIIMPGMNGWEVCRHIKEDETLQEIPISMLSVLSDTVDAHKSLNYALADTHLSKPIDFEQLSQTIKSLIEKRSNGPDRTIKKPKKPTREEPEDFFAPFSFDTSNQN